MSLANSQSREPGFSDELDAHGFGPAPTRCARIQPPLRHDQKIEIFRENDVRGDKYKRATCAEVSNIHVNHPAYQKNQFFDISELISIGLKHHMLLPRDVTGSRTLSQVVDILFSRIV